MESGNQDLGSGPEVPRPAVAISSGGSGPRRPRDPIAGLPSGVKVSRVRIKGVDYWRVRLGSRFTGGKVVQKHFQVLEDARKWAFGDAQRKKADSGLSLLELKAKAGATAFQLRPAQIAEAIDAFKRLEGTDLTLTEAIDFALKHSRPAAGVISVAEAIKLASERKKSRSKDYKKDFLPRWGRFERWLPAAKKKAVHLVTRLDVQRFLAECKLKPKGESNMKKNLSPLFSWAVGFHYMTENPCKGIKTEDNGPRKPPRILTIPEVRKLLETAQKDIVRHLRVGKDSYDDVHVFPGDLIPWITLGLYAGLRPDEAKILLWEDINFVKRRLTVREPDGGRGRTIQNLEPILLEWLQPLRPAGGKGTMCANHRWKFRAFRQELGEGWKPWPQDSLRHSYASYHLARDEEAGSTSLRMGHRNPNTTFQYYVDTVEEGSDVAVYWSLTPKRVKELAKAHPLND